jgi:predicted Zn-dependent protease
LLVAVLAGLITVWLMAVGQARGSDVGHSSVPEQLAVVQVQTGENLQHLAVRVAPDASVSRVVERIKQLNGLGSAALSPGQTLIVPVR